MKPQNDKEFQELNKHKGTENYEVVELCDKKSEIETPILFDKQNKNIIVKAYKKQPLGKRGLYHTKRITNLGESIEVLDNSYRILKDGTIWGGDFYINWIINGNSTKQRNIDPFSNKEIKNTYKYEINEKDPQKWLLKFKELYAKSQYIYIYI